jgi:citrate synthase
MLGVVHGGAGEQCVALLNAIAARFERDATEQCIADAVDAELRALADHSISHVPGFGHRFHPVDPRAPRLLALVDEAAAKGSVGGRFAAIGRALEDALAARKGRRIPMNIDGATAVVYAELGFAPALCRGLFVLSRSVGALAHAWEEMQAGHRNKGPIPRHLLWNYTGPTERSLPEERQ